VGINCSDPQKLDSVAKKTILFHKGGFSMTKKHRTFSPEFKAQTVIAVISGSKTAAEICREHQLKPDVFSKWKAAFLANAAKVFERETTIDPQQERIADLEQLVGRLTLELDVAKKASKLLRPVASNGEQ
jgi:transposase